MRQVTDNFKNNIKTYGRQFNFKVNIDDVEISDDDINYIKPSFNSNLFKTIMHKIEIDFKNSIPLKSKIKVMAGVKLNEKDYEYITYNTCAVNSVEKKEDTNSYVALAYDKMLESMIDYDLTISEQITLRNYLIQICQRLGWNTNNIPAIFINSDKLVDPRLHIGIGYTFRDVLDEIATISCSFLLFKGEDFFLVYPTETNQEIDNEYLNEDNVTIGEKYFINSLVFSRVEESDNIFRKDDKDIQLNGLHEYRVSDNQLLSTNDRDLYIDEMFRYLKAFEFYTFDVESKGILFLEACDRFTFSLNGEIYSTILLNDEIAFEDGLTEGLYVDKPEETETEYKYADATDKRINQTYILVDKQNQVIESVVSQTTEQNEKINRVTQTIDELNSKIGDIADITISEESLNGTIKLSAINQSEPIYVKIYPRTENISYLYPHNNLFPGDDLYPKGRTLRFENTATGEQFDYVLPGNLLYYDAENYDEFILDYGAQTCVVNKKVGYNADGTTYVLETPTTIEYEYPRILLTDGDYTVTMLGYPTSYLFVRLMTQNIYTTQFATKAEVNSEISQTAQSIDISVDKKLTNYSTTTQMNSAINIKANEITSNVSETYATKGELNTTKSEIKQTTDSISLDVKKKVNNEDFTSANITLKLNDGTSAAKIKADKISLEGKQINLTSDNTTIVSNNFSVDKYGNMTCNNANIVGGELNLNGSYNSPKIKTNGTGYFWSNALNEITPDGFKVKINNSQYIDMYVSKFSDNIYTNMPVGLLILKSYSGKYTQITGEGIIVPYISVDGEIYATGDIRSNGTMYAHGFHNTSQESQKKNIKKYSTKCVDLIKNSDIYTFNYKEEKDTDKKHIGFIIGDNYKTPNEVISKTKDGIDIYSMISVLWKTVQEQQATIEALQETAKALQKEVKELKGEQ